MAASQLEQSAQDQAAVEHLDREDERRREALARKLGPPPTPRPKPIAERVSVLHMLFDDAE